VRGSCFLSRDRDASATEGRGAGATNPSPLRRVRQLTISLHSFRAHSHNRTNSHKGALHRMSVRKKPCAVGRSTQLRRTTNCRAAGLRKQPGRAGLESGLSSRLENLTWQEHECVPLFKAPRQRMGVPQSGREHLSRVGNGPPPRN